MILLIFPSMYPNNPGRDVDPLHDLNPDEKVVPFGILSVASIIAAQGMPVKLIDSRFHPKREILDQIEAALPHVAMVGFSVMTVQIPHALLLTSFIKARRPQLPVVWGGIHPTLFPEQTLASPEIDYIINGEGAQNIARLTALLAGGSGDLAAIEGLGYKRNGEVVLNPPGPPAEVNLLPPLNYALIDVENYVRRKLLNGAVVRGLDILTSRGCPYRCTFCVNSYLHHRKWRQIESASVTQQIMDLAVKHRIDHIWFADDYMFASKRRVLEILTMLVQSGLNLSWEANIRANNFREDRIDDEALELIKKSGCVALTMGFESGSDRMLEFYKKDITVADILHAVQQCKKYGIYVKGFFIMGAPSETIAETLQTFGLIYKLTNMYDRYVPNAPGIYRPYPGGELYNYAITHYRFDVPATLEQWNEACLSSGYLDPRRFPWITNLSMLRDLRFYGRLLAGGAKGVFDRPLFLPIKALSIIVGLRFKFGFWGLRIEAKTFYLIYGFLKRHYRILKALRIPYQI